MSSALQGISSSDQVTDLADYQILIERSEMFSDKLILAYRLKDCSEYRSRCLRNTTGNRWDPQSKQIASDVKLQRAILFQKAFHFIDQALFRDENPFDSDE